MIDIIPPELEAAFAKNRRAAELFAALPPSHKQQYVRWVAAAKKVETRARRAEKAVDMIASATTLMTKD